MKHGSFRNCARQIGVSQVAISDHIRQLEQRLGHKLFERISGGASVLKPAGKRAYAHATHILAGMDKLIAEMAQANARTEERGEGKEWVRRWRSRWWRYH